ncbi:Glycosyl hydrolase family 43 protein [Coniochaeta hoffmannii]|uniref:Glycosyl hydrolase family 43 protein n=1 Tax=Coniochaeta hoffmannii TaxID=91930 RepID=A0AA38RZ12_9PEZI|nr:Glycosyl hydrolase family 43 protein [Coniochaeta hoffmannii]
MLLPLILCCLAASAHAAGTFHNPVLWEDLADLDVFRVGDTFYYSASTMHYSPGAPVLRSYNLVEWEYAGHSVPSLDFGAKYDLNGSSSGGRAYVDGIWASSLRYRPGNDRFYWIGCVDFAQTHVYTAEGKDPGRAEWKNSGTIGTCYYDCGLLVDDDDVMYVAYGNTNISVARLTADGLAEETTRVVYPSPSGVYIEGSRFYKVNGTYYILVTRPADAELVLRSESPWGPYTQRTLVDKVATPVDGSGYPHQGGLVETAGGEWYYMAFIDAYPGGRVPVLAPVTWTADGWPTVVTVNGGWGVEYPVPVPVRTAKAVEAPTGIDTFQSSRLSALWEWNHNPDNSRWRLSGSGGGLTLGTASVTTDIFSARNTLTRRILGPQSSGTFRVDISGMADGDRAGAVLFRDWSSYIGVWRGGNSSQLVVVDGARLDRNNNWATSSNGTVVATGPDLAGVTEVWLRITADIRPGGGLGVGGTLRNGSFSWSRDGAAFSRLGPEVQMNNMYYFFMGPRFGVFNFATKKLGGEVRVRSFEIQQ